LIFSPSTFGANSFEDQCWILWLLHGLRKKSQVPLIDQIYLFLFEAWDGERE
jgi:hypothetical protein